MPLPQTHLPGEQILRRKPLQDKNLSPNHPPLHLNANKQPWIHIESNKENCCNYSSLAAELTAVRKKMDRLKQDRDKTERMFRERDALMDIQFNAMEDRGDIQKQLEMEVDRLFRLKELRSYCMRTSPIRTLRLREREREKEKKINGPSHTTGAQDEDDVEGSTAPEPISDLDSGELVAEP